LVFLFLGDTVPRPFKQHPLLTKESLIQEYVHKLRTAKSIAKQIGVDERLIGHRLKKFDIPRRDTTFADGHSVDLDAVLTPEQRILWEKLSKERLEKLYIRQQLTAEEIAIMTKCHHCTILKALKRHKIPIRPPIFSKGYVPPHKGLTKEQHPHAAAISKGKKGRPNPHCVGPRNWRWNGGPDRPGQLGRRSNAYTLWRKAVWERDDFTCQHCWKRGGRLHAHHIKPWATHKELRLELSNGLTLCKPCHDKIPRCTKKSLS
jgi:hypothetical protein